MSAALDYDLEEVASKCRGSFLYFCETFFPLVTGREFIVSKPVSRESHHIIIARALTQCFRLEIPNHRLAINVQPGAGKSVMLAMWVAWAYTHYADCNFLYCSYSKSLATKHTEFIRRIMSHRQYQFLFDVKLRSDSTAKDTFKTTENGTVMALGTTGSVTGNDVGLPNCNRFSGALILDDPIKPDDATSDTMRQNVIDNYSHTLQQRARGVNVPFVFIGQRVHESDLGAYLLDEKDGYPWHPIILKSIDDAGNALYPEAFPLDMLLKRQATDAYVFSSQYQQDPIPAGGALFKKEWFIELNEEPKFVSTFITADTAETDKTWNDATVFSFWGLYEIEEFGHKTGELGLHWLDCYEVRVEPKDLHSEFMTFYQDCMRHKMPPKIAAIEKKSTGVTLVSVLEQMRTLQIMAIDRHSASGSKAQRFIQIQPYIAGKKVSYTIGARHMPTCLEHMSKITANDSHRHDDIADTISDAIRIGLIDKSIATIHSPDDIEEDERTQDIFAEALNRRRTTIL